MASKINVYKREPEIGAIQHPFDGDEFDRKKMAEKLTALMDRATDGMVIAIDAPWGEGKTWFGRHWNAMLVEQGYRAAYIDCFRHDYVEDPFLLVASEIVALASTGKGGSRRKLLEAGKKLGASLLPSTAKFVANAVGHWAVGNAGLGDDVVKALQAAEESGASALEKLVAKRLEDFEADKKSVEGFQSALTAFAAECEKPVIVFLDELDRCRPDFAVKTLERVKHFFDVTGIFFVLLMNRRQLTAAIEGIYGPKVDADAYLGKFVHITVSLPKRESLKLRSHDDNTRHCEKTMIRYGFIPNRDVEQFSMHLGVLANLMRLSLRDIERAVTLFAYAQPTGESPEIAWSIGLKVSDPAMFSRLRAGDRQAHMKAAAMAADWAEQAPDLSSMFRLLEEIHRCGAQGWVAQKDSKLDDRQRLHLAQRGGPQDVFRWIFEKVDLSVVL